MKYTKNKQFIGGMFDEISPTYDKLNHLLSGYQDNRWRKNAVKYLATLSSNYDNILDLASGSGDLGMEFLKLNPKRIFSADLSFEMLKIDKAKLPIDINQAVKAEAEHLPFKSGYFDLCGIGFGVRNFERLTECTTEIARVLKPGGKFITIEMFKPLKPNIANKSFRLYFEKILPKIGNTLSKSDYAYSYLFESVDNFINIQQYSEILQKSGFKIMKTTNNFLGIVNSIFAEKL
jgi:demethylmenaquinone methyltransferase/2-methoxy-6-polyprenyl-1,4-benzoquinol methylase